MSNQYNIAVVQNHRELNQYSYADIVPLINGFKFDYNIFTYYAENIPDLFNQTFEDLDAIILATNACNDNRILLELDKNKRLLEQFLNDGKGLFILFQKKLATLTFLPNIYEINFTDKEEKDLLDGDISINDLHKKHPVLICPKLVCTNHIKKSATKNADLQGLYWRFLETGNKTRVDTLLLDSSKNSMRKLLVGAGLETGHKLLITTLMLDWQKQLYLLENCLKYIVEGKPSVTFLRKKGNKDFYINYIIKTLRTSKIPYFEVCQENLRLDQVPPVCDTIIIDPSWQQEDEAAVLEKKVYEYYLKDPSLCYLYFDEISVEGSRKSVVKSIGGRRRYSLLFDRIDAWLHSHLTKDCAYWDDSFLSTMVAIELIKSLKNKDQYLQVIYDTKISAKVQTHALQGSYDGVFGATCSLLKLYSFFDKDKVEETEKWLISRYENQKFSEQILFINTLADLSYDLSGSNLKVICTLDEIATRIRKELSDSQIRNTTLSLERYAQFLYSNRDKDGFRDIAKTVVKKLIDLQDKKKGCWKNITQTARITNVLMQISEWGKDNGFNKIEDAIFSAIIFLKSYVNNVFESKYNTTSEVIASEVALSLSVLSTFEKQSSYNMDELLLNLNKSQTGNKLMTSEISRIIDSSIDLHNLNETLSIKLAEVKNENSRLLKIEKDSERMSNSFHFSQYTIYSLYSILILTLTVISIVYFKNQTGISENSIFIEKWQSTIFLIFSGFLAIYCFGMNVFTQKLQGSSFFKTIWHKIRYFSK